MVGNMSSIRLTIRLESRAALRADSRCSAARSVIISPTTAASTGSVLRSRSSKAPSSLEKIYRWPTMRSLS